MSQFVNAILCILIGTGLVGSKNIVLADSRSGIKSIASQRVSNQFLVNSIAKGSSLISVQSKNRLSRILGQLDRVNQSILIYCQLEPGSNLDSEELINLATGNLPRLTPLSERAVFYSLMIQVEALDMVLGLTNRDKVEQLQKERLLIRVLKQEQRIFGDIRDHLLAEILRMDRNIFILQTQFGINNSLDFTFPSQLENLSQVEKHLLKIIKGLTDNHKALLMKIQGGSCACG